MMSKYFIIFIMIGAAAFPEAVSGQSADRGAGMHTYIISHTHGTVRMSETEIICEVKAVSPIEAVKKALKQCVFFPDSYESWEIQEYSRTGDYAQLENPASFVSDMIDFYAARKGSLPRNSSGELYFLIRHFSRGIVIKSAGVWGAGAAEAIKAYLADLDCNWPVTAESKFRAYAEKPPAEKTDACGEWIDAAIDGGDEE